MYKILYPTEAWDFTAFEKRYIKTQTEKITEKKIVGFTKNKNISVTSYFNKQLYGIKTE